MKIKKRVIPMLAGVLTAVMLTSTASAHPFDYWSGKYIGKNNAEILLRIDTSAQTSLLTWGDVYQYGYDWNGISSNVKVSLALAGPGTPSLYGAMSVRGEIRTDGSYGGINTYDSNGNLMNYNGCADDNWKYAEITMNIDPTIFDKLSNSEKVIAGRKVFLHEVGHLLKLCHPMQNSSISDHTIHGRPYAVMNQGLPYPKVLETSPTITQHDKSCLITKWGA